MWAKVTPTGPVKCLSTKTDPKSEVEKDTLKGNREEQQKLIVSCLANGSLAHLVDSVHQSAQAHKSLGASGSHEAGTSR